MKLKLVAFTFIITFLSVGHSYAQNACRADYFRYCKGVKPGEGRIIKCLNKNIGKLTPQCKDATLSITACALDFKRLCPNIKPGNKKGAVCLKKNLDRLSPRCARLMKTASK